MSLRDHFSGHRLTRAQAYFRSAAAVMTSLLILAGCSAASAAGTTSSTPPSASELNIQPIPTATWNSMLTHCFSSGELSPGTRDGALVVTEFGYLQSLSIEGFLELALADWTVSTPSSYSAGGDTLTWSHSGNTWTWTIVYYVETVKHTIVFTVTSTSSGWNLTATEDGVQWLTGSVSSNGTQGTATLTDPTGAISGTVTVAWASATSPYSYKYTITATGAFIASPSGDSAASATMVLETDSLGAYWTWSYLDSKGDTDSYTYPPVG